MSELECVKCGSSENVRNTLNYDTGVFKMLCWPCRRPLVMKRIDGDDFEEKEREIEAESGSNGKEKSKNEEDQNTQEEGNPDSLMEL